MNKFHTLLKGFVMSCFLLMLSQAVYAKMEIERIPLVGEWAFCLGGEFTSGHMQVMTNIVHDAEGGLHLTVREQFINATAVDADGNFYRVVGNENLQFLEIFESSINLNPGGSATYHVTVQQVMVPIGNPGAHLFMVHGHIQLTVNANGDIVVFDIKIDVDCPADF